MPGTIEEGLRGCWTVVWVGEGGRSSLYISQIPINRPMGALLVVVVTVVVVVVVVIVVVKSLSLSLSDY